MEMLWAYIFVRAIAALPSTLQLMLKNIERETGYKGSIMLGGWDPSTDGISTLL